MSWSTTRPGEPGTPGTPGTQSGAPSLLDPLQASRRIADDYVRYLRTALSPAEPELRTRFEAQPGDGAELSRGPILQAQAPYSKSSTISDLITEGVLPTGLQRLSETGFGLDRQLYAHQESAIRKLRAGRNLMVATGTGSGKTESFLLPVLAHLVDEIAAGTADQPGVRALLLYPMNALANDQMDRLRTMFEPYPELTFGRYVGDTEHTYEKGLDQYRLRKKASPLPNELVSRDQMKERPPHVLLTNFAMLEYLLLRPEDQRLFDGPTGNHWRFLVLDEVHVYDGAKGAEIGMLLRRVRDRINGSERGRLTCVGTSATLGRGAEDAPRLIHFADQLFDEPFEWDATDADRQDIIEATRDDLALGAADWTLDPAHLVAVRDAFRSLPEQATAGDLIAASGVDDLPPALDDEPAPHWLGRVLSSESHVVALQELLGRGSADVGRAAEAVIGATDRTSRQQLSALVDVCVSAELAGVDRALLPARWHYLLRSLEGAYGCLASTHPDGVPRISLHRRLHCPGCRGDRRSAMFELAVCRRCGARYAVGEVNDDDGIAKLLPPGLRDSRVRHLLVESALDGADDEDDLAGAVDDEAETRNTVRLCLGCGAFAERGDPPCDCGGEVREMVEVHPASDDAPVRSCAACGSRTSAGSILQRFLTGSDAPVAVITTSLYQELPPAPPDPDRDEHAPPAKNGGRKLLSFADSRQDAAFFAPYLERTYNRAVQRRLLWEALQRKVADGATAPRLAEVRTTLQNLAMQYGIVEAHAQPTPEQQARHWLYAEILSTDRQQNLEGVGLVEVAVPIPDGLEAPPPLLELGLTESEVFDLMRVLLDTVRRSRAITTDLEVDLTDPIFEGRPTTSLRGFGVDKGVLSWSPVKGTNRRVEYLQKVLDRLGSDADATELLAAMWDNWLSQTPGDWDNVLVAGEDNFGRGVLRRLATDRLELRPASPDHQPSQCDSCRQVWWRHVRGACPTVKCEGTVSTLDPANLAENHYRRLYTALSPIGIRVEEHTAQLATSLAARRQQEFLDGQVNALSCSTTFELGVDVGEIQAVLMRNVPPTAANYVQRAGRAGRRAGSPALVVTFAQRRSHDLHFFDQPHTMIDGHVSPPVVDINNPALVVRHLNAVAFATFLRTESGGARKVHSSVAEFFEPEGDAASDRLLAWLRTRPAELAADLARVCPSDIAEHAAIGLREWAWADGLDGDPTDPDQGRLVRAAQEYRLEVDGLVDQEADAAAAQQYARAGAIKKVLATVRRNRTIDVLARRGVLPKYGFPVDVVSLQVSAEQQLSLDRDLSQAVLDFAPGAQTVANKHLFTSTAIKIPPGMALLVYAWAKCESCDSFRIWLDELEPPACTACGSDELATRGRFVHPRFGFIGNATGRDPGERRPIRNAARSFFFNDYVGSQPTEVQSELGTSTVAVLTSKQGQITVLNRGPKGQQYLVCRWCGWAAPAPAHGQRVEDHRQPYGKGKNCNGTPTPLSLGHYYLTDTVELRLPMSMTRTEALSTLHALLAATEDIGIAHEDVHGTLHGTSSLILFDSVPGGAGHAQRLSEDLPALFNGARKRVEFCDCGPETSCYGCLRSYRNQSDHDTLSRGEALHVFDQLGV